MTFVILGAFVVIVLWRLDWLMRHAVLATFLLGAAAGVSFVVTVERRAVVDEYSAPELKVQESHHTSFVDLTAQCPETDRFVDGVWVHGKPAETCPFSLTVEVPPAKRDGFVTLVISVENRSRFRVLVQGSPPDERGYQSSTCDGGSARTVLDPRSVLECRVVFDARRYVSDRVISSDVSGTPQLEYVGISTRTHASYWYRDYDTLSSIQLSAPVPAVPWIDEG